MRTAPPLAVATAPRRPRSARLFSAAAMNHRLLPVAFVLCSTLPTVRGQEPPAATPPAAPVSDGTEGFGRAASYRQALAMALEDAVGKARGVAVARGGGFRARLDVVSRGREGVPANWFDGEAEYEREWVQQQISGFVETWDVTKKGKADDGQWEVTVRAKIATGSQQGPFVIELDDEDLRRWQLARFEEGGAAVPFAKVDGTYEAPSIRDNLRATGRVRIVAKDGGVSAAAGAAPRERGKAGHHLVASHRVRVQWQPMQFTSLVEKPNIARPTTGPRPQYLTAGSVRVTVAISDLVLGLDVFDRPLTIGLEVPPGTAVERLDAMAVQLADLAKAAVAESVFFALQPPTVARKWAGEGGDWFVEVAIGKRVANGYDAFAVGNQGSLASPDWRPLGRAALVGGTDTTCTFRLVDVADPSRIEAGVTEVRPARK